MKKGLALGALAFLFVAVVGPQRAEADDLHDCAASYEQTQRFQQKNQLVDALDEADKCSRAVCPALLRDDCTKWKSDLEKKLPSIVLHVRGGDGCALTEARVSVDGNVRKGTGGALFVDPGTREIDVVDPATNQEKKESMSLGAGEKRDVDIDFARPGAVCPRPSQDTPIGKVPTISLVTGTVGAGFLVIGAGLGIVGAVKRGDLDDCKPNCSDSRINSVRPFFVTGDILAGVGLLAVAVGAISYFVLQPSHAKTGWFVTPDGAGATF